MQSVSIGALSSETGVKIPTIRYYESIGLLDAADRSASNRRLYGPDDTRRLRFIRHARELGFEVEAIRQLLALAADQKAPAPDAGPAPATDRVGLPKNYRDTYTVLRRENRAKKQQVVTSYGNPSAASVMRKEELPYPYGSVFVLETAEAIVAKEAAMAKAILSGTPIGQVMGGQYEHMLEN